MISYEIKRIFDLLRQKIWEKRQIEMRRFYSLRYQIMMNCWQNEPEARPSFTALTKQLRDMENQHKVGLLVPCDKKYFSDISNDNNFSAIRLTISSNVHYN